MEGELYSRQLPHRSQDKNFIWSTQVIHSFIILFLAAFFKHFITLDMLFIMLVLLY
jgi:hypothetical protein